MSTPLAAVQFFKSGTQVGSGYYPAPVYIGDRVTFDNIEYQVVATSWPYRVNGMCPDGDTDWEFADVTVYVNPGSK